VNKLPGRGTQNKLVESTYFDESPMNRAVWNLSLIMRDIANNGQNQTHSPSGGEAAASELAGEVKDNVQ
jgi:hypothetical protein